jgi:hypothetical protein
MSAGPPLPFDRLLWLAANPAPERVRGRLVAEARGYDRWQELAYSAEAHGIAPLIDRHFAHEDFAGLVPSEVRTALKGLLLRHKRANATRRVLIKELADATTHDGTPMMFLKGGALAFDVYADPSHRTMRDLDVLVREDDLVRIGERLLALGYETDDAAGWATDRSHWHHQAEMRRVVNGFTMTIEVHRQLGIDDSRARRRYEDLEEGAVAFDLDGTSVRTLGATDMLLHVHYHGFTTPLEWPDRVRLVSAADLVALLDARHTRIDWERVRRDAPHLTESLAWMHALTPFSDSALGALGISTVPRELAIGNDYRGKRRERDRERPDRLRHWGDTFFPPEWWLRIRHGGSAGSLGLATCWLRHLRELV